MLNKALRYNCDSYMYQKWHIFTVILVTQVLIKFLGISMEVSVAVNALTNILLTTAKAVRATCHELPKRLDIHSATVACGARIT